MRIRVARELTEQERLLIQHHYRVLVQDEWVDFRRWVEVEGDQFVVVYVVYHHGEEKYRARELLPDWKVEELLETLCKRAKG